MSNLIVNTENAEYVRVTNNRGRIGIGTPYVVNPENNSEIIVPLSSIRTKRSMLLTRLNATANASPSTLRTLYNYNTSNPTADDQEDRLVEKFEQFLRDVLYAGGSVPPDAVDFAATGFFPYTSAPFSKIGQARDYITGIMGDWVRLFEDIINKKSGLSREQVITPTPTPSIVPIPTPLPSWRDCVTGLLVQRPIPTDWIQTTYAGDEGGFCREPVFITITSSSRNFTYNTFTQQNPIPVTYTFRNTSSDRSYAINLLTDNEVFNVNPNAITLSPTQSRTVTITLPSQNINKFVPGVTNFRLQMNITKS